MTFAEKLKHLRESEDLTQSELVKKLVKKAPGMKLTRDQLTNWEQGRNNPRQEAMLVIARYFKTTLEDLFNPAVSIKKLLANRTAATVRKTVTKPEYAE